MLWWDRDGRRKTALHVGDLTGEFDPPTNSHPTTPTGSPPHHASSPDVHPALVHSGRPLPHSVFCDRYRAHGPGHRRWVPGRGVGVRACKYSVLPKSADRQRLPPFTTPYRASPLLRSSSQATVYFATRNLYWLGISESVQPYPQSSTALYAFFGNVIYSVSVAIRLWCARGICSVD